MIFKHCDSRSSPLIFFSESFEIKKTTICSKFQAALKKFQFSSLLRALATFDALFLLSALIAFGIPNMSEWFTDHVFMPILAPIYGFMHIFRVGSVYVTLAVTYERFLSVVFPLKVFP